jgi:uncharacterized protein YidB (DUF937 family)
MAMALSDILGKLGGEQGQQGGIASLQRMIHSSGGLQGITSKLSSNGLGQQVQSWVGHGQNQPLSGSHVQQAVDPRTLDEMSRQSGMSPEETSDHVAKALPDAVDHATPDGKMPENDPFEKGLDAVKRMLKV